MKVSAKAEYACLAVIELAANYDAPQPVRVKAIADSHGIPQRFLVQILLQLKGAGLVVSLRGAAGGYQLARPPEEISLADVINAIDRTAPPSERRTSPKRRTPAGPTGSLAASALQSVWRDIQAEEQRLLEATTLAELVRRTQQNNALSYQI
jgi:Rrf2 family cysteine metabolism transcriptional repressor